MSNPSMKRKTWRDDARHKEPKAWASFRRAARGKHMGEHVELHAWEFFLAGWKRRSRAWPFNTLSGWYRKAVHGA